MSRSYKHTPRCGDTKSKYGKRLANHAVRRKGVPDAFPQYAGYKKLFESWNICDYERVGESFGRYCASAEQWRRLRGQPLPNRDEIREEYERWFIRK